MTDEEILAILSPYWDDNPGNWPWPPRTNYYEHYTRWAQAVQPERILEIGVMYGWSMMAMLLGHPAKHVVLIDSELYKISVMESGVKVADFCRDQGIPCPAIHTTKLNTRTVTALRFPVAAYDLIHIDGEHSEAAVYNDLNITFPLLAVGGTIIVDDISLPGIREGADRFLAEHPELVAEEVRTHQVHYLITEA